LAQRGSEGPAVLAIQAVFTGAAPDLLRWLVRWPLRWHVHGRQK